MPSGHILIHSHLKEIKGLKLAIKDTNNPQQLKELNKQLDQQKALLKEVTKTQRAAADTVTKEGVFGTKSVKGLKARLKELKNEFDKPNSGKCIMPL